MSCRFPFWPTRREDRKVLLEQRGVADVFQLGVESTLRLVGIGAIDDDASILSTGLVERHEFEEARALGAVGELLGHLFSSRGDLIESGVSARARFPCRLPTSSGARRSPSPEEEPKSRRSEACLQADCCMA